MCLYTFTNKPTIADKDIICYKNIEAKMKWKINKKFAKVVFVTPYQNFLIPDNHILVEKRNWKYINEGDFLSIISGGFHSYVNLRATLEMKNNDEITIKAIIPKGTPYLEGNEIPYKLLKRDTWTNDIMSRKLILKDPVNIENNMAISVDDILIGGCIYIKTETVKNIWAGKDGNTFNVKDLWKKAVKEQDY